MKRKLVIIVGAILLAGGIFTFAQSGNKASCPYEGTPECALVQACPDYGTPDCPLVPACCANAK